MTAFAASAGDVAEMRPIGFSPDGRFFALEQFGEQDGSGFAYAEIQVIDTETDSYVPGTPVSVLIRREEASVGEARRESLKQAKTILDIRKIGDDPGFLVALAPIGELSEKRHELRYQAFPSFYVSDGIACLWKSSAPRVRNSAAAWTSMFKDLHYRWPMTTNLTHGARSIVTRPSRRAATARVPMRLVAW
jgi:hypothetical protein